jgi:hypothetical protein
MMREPDNIWDVVFVTAARQFPEDAKEILEIDLAAGDKVIIEDWRLRADKAQTLINDDMIGPQAKGFIVGAMLLAGHKDPPILQSPAILDFTSLVGIGFDVLTIQTVHEADALKHILYYLGRGDH